MQTVGYGLMAFQSMNLSSMSLKDQATHFFSTDSKHIDNTRSLLQWITSIQVDVNSSISLWPYCSMADKVLDVMRDAIGQVICNILYNKSCLY